MKVQCFTRELVDAVSLLASVIPANPSRPILQFLLVNADDQGLRLEATDLDIALAVRLDKVMVEKPGRAAVPAQRLLSILRELREDDVRLEFADGRQFLVKAESAEFRLPTESPEEFPAIEFKSAAHIVQLPREALLQAIRRVAIAAAKDTTRYQMHSLLFDCKADRVCLVSTDGKRLALEEIPLSAGSTGKGAAEAQYILPLKSVELLTRVLSGAKSEEAELQLDPAELTYRSDSVMFSSKLVEGKYPPYERAIPTSFEQEIEFSCPSFQTALKQAALLTSKDTNSVRFTFEGERLVLSTSTTGVGESRIELPVVPVHRNGEAFSINFNPHFLLDLIRVADAPQLRGRFRDNKTAGLFTTDAERGAYRHIVMPLVTTE